MGLWTEEHERILRDLWARGYTGTEIAEELPPLPPTAKRPARKVNRDMVIAKARRLKLASRPSPIVENPK